jgi:hypothetical protein
MVIKYRASGDNDARFTSEENAFPIQAFMPNFPHRQVPGLRRLNKYTSKIKLDDATDEFYLRTICVAAPDEQGSGGLVTHTVIYEGTIEDVVDYFDSDRQPPMNAP